MYRSLLCETVTGRTTPELIAARDAARGVDMVELRLDGVSALNVEQALKGRRLPVVVTCRPTWEGGRFEGPEEDRRRVLASALCAGAEYVDVELAAGFDDMIRAHGERVIVSMHDFTGIPSDLSARVRAMRATGAATIKVAVTPTRLSDMRCLLEIAQSGPAVVIGMGDVGVVSRLLATRFGSQWTYAGQGVAPGQVPATRMLETFHFRRVGPETAVYGVVGNNVTHSLSPAMHNAAFADAGLDAVYVPIGAADFEDFLAFAAVVGVQGASVTIPFKQDAFATAEGADTLSRQVGAANTVRRHGSSWEATNTDVAGFLAPLDAMATPLDGIRVAVLGPGGSARAVAAALSSRGARVVSHSRRQAQAQATARAVDAAAAPWPPPDGSWDMLVNCTPLGSAAAPDASPLPGGPFGGRIVYDLTYGTAESPLIRDARKAGCTTLDGLPMLVAQAEQQFEWWTGRSAGAGVMRAAAEKELAGRRDGLAS